MTKEDIKKRLECAARITGNDLFVDAYKIITEQEREIERLKDENEQLEEDIDMIIKEQKDDCKFDIKQAQIDVLNKLKKKTHNYYPSIDSYCMSQHVVLVREIDELIKEIENDRV